MKTIFANSGPYLSQSAKETVGHRNLWKLYSFQTLRIFETANNEWALFGHKNAI